MTILACKLHLTNEASNKRTADSSTPPGDCWRTRTSAAWWTVIERGPLQKHVTEFSPVMLQSTSKFEFVECKFQLINSFECKFEWHFIGPWKPPVSASCIVPNKWTEPKMYCITLTAYMGNWGPAASLPGMIWLVCTFSLLLLAAVRFTRMKLLVEQAFSHEFAFHKKRSKHLMNFECGENVRSSNGVECHVSGRTNVLTQMNDITLWTTSLFLYPSADSTSTHGTSHSNMHISHFHNKNEQNCT